MMGPQHGQPMLCQRYIFTNEGHRGKQQHTEQLLAPLSNAAQLRPAGEYLDTDLHIGRGVQVPAN